MSDHPTSPKNRAQKVVAILQKLIKSEKEARERSGIKEAFKYIPAQLKAILERFMQETGYDPNAEIDLQEHSESAWPQPLEGQVPVYIYLYHAQGVRLENWLQLLTPTALTELAITRPIYQEERYLQRFFEKRPHQPHYAYLVAYVELSTITAPEPRYAVDREGHPLIRLRENTLTLKNIIGLVHNTLGRFVFKNGQLIAVPNSFKN